MQLQAVRDVLKAKVLVGEEYLQRDVKCCCGSDLMSDVLAFTQPNSLLCTGLSNIQVVRTADMTELCGVIIVRGKMPARDFLEAAQQSKLPVLTTDKSLFEVCGILYHAGLRDKESNLEGGAV